MSVSEHFTAALAGGGTALAVFTQDGLSSLDSRQGPYLGVRLRNSDRGGDELLQDVFQPELS